MIKEIDYKGYSTIPSDYEVDDGWFLGMENFVPDDGALHPISPVNNKFLLPDGGELLFIHATPNYKHYIVSLPNGSLVWGDEPAPMNWRPIPDGGSGDIRDINAVGNTLVVCKDEISYFLWEGNSYEKLGNSLPQLEISFGLRGTAVSYCKRYNVNHIEINLGNTTIKSAFEEYWESKKDLINSSIMAAANKFIKEESIDKGKFCFPFLLRYAFRLYDGSLSHHSAPILMCPSTGDVPLIDARETVTDVNGGSMRTLLRADMMLMSSNLTYQIVGDWTKELDKWKDIITGVDIFVSKPIYTHDTNKGIEKESLVNGVSISAKQSVGSFVGTLSPSNGTGIIPNMDERNVVGGGTGAYVSCYSVWNLLDLYNMHFSRYRSDYMPILRISPRDWHKDIERGNNTFFKLHSISLNELEEGIRKDILIDEGYLQSLMVREAMSDDYLSRDSISSTKTMVYNNRLHLIGSERKLFCGFRPVSMVSYVDARVVVSSQAPCGVDVYADEKVYGVITELGINGNTYGVSSPTDNGGVALYNVLSTEMRDWYRCFFYGNLNASIMHFTETNGTSYKGTLRLKKHEFLNGCSFFYRGSDTIVDNVYEDTTGGINISAIDRIRSRFVGGKIIDKNLYVSDVNNPFSFPAKGVYSIGNGDIRGISSATKPISTGQFGQYPLYAFTSDGVWALSVGNTGEYMSKQPVTRDVCIDVNSITPIDGGVLFLTDRGLMLLSGGDSVCLTDTIYKKHKDASPLRSKLGVDHVDMSTFLKGCDISFDYNHSRILVINKNYNYGYVYNTRSKMWGMMTSDTKYFVPSYPNAVGVRSDGYVVDYSDDSFSSHIRGRLITRPIKLDMRDVLKTIDTIIQRGYFRSGNIKTILYGSRDLFNWYVVSSSKDHYLRGYRGSPYKYFCIELICDMRSDESITGCSVQFTPRYTNRLR